MGLANASKMARLSTSISNRANCGGVKKAGSPTSGIGVPSTILPAYNNTCKCLPAFTLKCKPGVNTFPSQSAYWKARL
jgi:hypothetical protein